MNATSPTPFIIAAPPRIGSLPAALVCYILYGLGAFLPVAFIVIVAIGFSCRRRLRRTKSLASDINADDDRIPEIRKTETNNVGSDDVFDTLHGFPFPLPSSQPLSLDLISETTQSVDNPNVYFRQSPVKLVPNPATMDDFRELNSGSTLSFGRVSHMSSVSRSTLQIRRLNEDPFTTATPNHQIVAPEMDVRQLEVKSWNVEDTRLKPCTAVADSMTSRSIATRLRITNESEYLDTDQEKALRYLDEINDNLEQDLGDVSAYPFSVTKQDGVSHEGHRGHVLNGETIIASRSNVPVDVVTHF